MALDLKEELHRLVDEIPDTRPDLARMMLNLVRVAALTHDLEKANPELQRLVRDVADLHAHADSSEELASGLDALRNRWVHGHDQEADALLRFLESAPDDDEPLTSEEAAMLDARLSALASGTVPTFSHEEVGRMLDEADRTLKE